MTLDEAIRHCQEVAERNTQGLYDAIALGGQSPTQEEIANCEQCASDHRQLAEWLQELKEWRENPFKMIKDICAAHEWCPDCQLSDHCIRASFTLRNGRWNNGLSEKKKP